MHKHITYHLSNCCGCTSRYSACVREFPLRLLKMLHVSYMDTEVASHAVAWWQQTTNHNGFYYDVIWTTV